MKDLQQQHQSLIRVNIRHEAITNELADRLKPSIQEHANITAWNNQCLMIDVQGEHDIPNILHLFFQANIGIYSVEQSQLSLEEIFLKQNQT